MREMITVVDIDDNALSSVEKIEAHIAGNLHRAFSIFVFNSEGKLLMQRRSRSKYHSGGLWSNTCCSHPRYGEDTEDAVHRRLQEEMGFDCEFKEVFSFIYKVKLDKLMIEHEYDHIFIGRFDGEPAPNTSEVEEWKWMSINEIKKEIKDNPEDFTFWFLNIIERVLESFESSSREEEQA